MTHPQILASSDPIRDDESVYFTASVLTQTGHWSCNEMRLTTMNLKKSSLHFAKCITIFWEA